MSSHPWALLTEADNLIVRYLARTGSVDDDLIRALILIREYNKDFEARVARIEIDEYQPAIH